MNLDGYENVKVHSLNPMVVTVDDFCSPDEVQRLMDHAGQLEFKSATVVDGPLDKQTRVDSTVRNATVCHPATCAAALSSVCDRVSALLGYQASACEAPTFTRYETGGEYKRHFDAIPRFPRARAFTAILYMNDDFEGGETEFPRIGLTLKPKAGRLAIWNNHRPGGIEPHPGTLHAGLPVESGTKWIVPIWVNRPR